MNPMQSPFHPRPNPPSPEIHFAGSVPYYSQVMDREHISDYLDHGRDLREDPLWQLSGAIDPDQYAWWALRSCGIVAAKSCIEAFGGPVRAIQEWIDEGLALGGYLVEETGGNHREIGWKHAALAQLCVICGIPAVPQAADLNGIMDAMRQGRLVIASVSFEIGTDRPITRRGGHLVVVTGIRRLQGQPNSVILHNPSGRGLALQAHAAIPVERFLQAYSGRAILVGSPNTNGTGYD